MYLGLAVSKETVFLVTQARWRAGEGKSAPGFGRQALPMVWDFADLNPFAGAGGDFSGVIEGIEKTLRSVPPPVAGNSNLADAMNQKLSFCKLVSTDPPYYDNIGYSDLSDFFYVWLRRSLKPIFPDLFTTLAVPKANELVATPYRHGSKEEAESFFLDGMSQTMRRLAEQTHPDFPVTIYYAFKQSETKRRPWDFQNRVGNFPYCSNPLRLRRHWHLADAHRECDSACRYDYTNALASSIVLVCRKRHRAGSRLWPRAANS